MKNEENIKSIIPMPICSFIGIIIGILVANAHNFNIGIGISMGFSCGFFIGSVIGLILSKVKTQKEKNNENKKE